MANQTGLQYSITVKGLSTDMLALVALSGKEGLSTPFQFNLELVSRHNDITANDVVDKEATITLYQDGEKQQAWNGIVSAFSRGDSGVSFTQYQLIIVPALSRLNLRHNSRIFQEQSVQDIITTLMGEMNIVDFDFELIRKNHIKREYCVQYQETDLAFIQRITAEEGIFYYFEQSTEKHIVVFCDDSAITSKNSTTMPYNTYSSGMLSERPHVRSFVLNAKVAPSKAVLKDYSFKKPTYDQLHNFKANKVDYQADIYEHFDAPGRYKGDEQGKPFTQTRLEALRTEAEHAQGISNIPQLISGHKTTLTDHPRDNGGDYNQDWLLVRIEHMGTQPQVLEELSGSNDSSTGDATTYNNQFIAIPRGHAWQPPVPLKPHTFGPTIATVVGPPGEEIYCDEFGRVKVLFSWDRYNKKNENASCWVRVSQGSAGANYGAQTLPRIGHEVIVSFLDGDPDQPIITGRTHHANNKMAYGLPANKTRTVMRTQTHKGSGYNELSFEDEAGKEELFLRAQKDQKIQVLNDKNQTVGVNETHNVGNDQTNSIGRDRTESVGNNETVNITANEMHSVGQNRVITVGQDDSTYVERYQTIAVKGIQSISVTDDQISTFKKNQTIYIDKNQTQTVKGDLEHSTTATATHTAGKVFTLICGKSQIMMTPGSLVLSSNGAEIMLNSDGIFQNGKKIKLN